MGLMTRLFGGGSPLETISRELITPIKGNHNIQKESVFKTDGGFTPTQNNFEGLRTVPAVEIPRYFDREEALALKQLEKEKVSGAKWSKRAYKSLKKIDTADSEVVKSHYNYARKIATNELDKQKSKASYGKHLHGLRGDYARLGHSYDQAHRKGDQDVANAISQIKQGLRNG